MKLIKPSVEFFGVVPTDYNNAIITIEKFARVCYKSEDKITPDSAEKFVCKLIKAGHLAMVEHSNFVIRTRTALSVKRLQGVVGKYLNVFDTSEYTYIGGNLTAWANLTVELHNGGILVPFINIWGLLFAQSMIAMESTWQVCPHDEIPKELHRYSAKFICNRAVTHEGVRHRPCSFAQESQRYVNYGGKEMEFIEPVWFDMRSYYAKDCFTKLCIDAEISYKKLLNDGLSPQQARAVLPNAIKTELVITADTAEWSHIRKLRTSTAADPEMQRVMNMMPWEEFL